MKNRINVWRKIVSNVPRQKLLSCKVLVTRASTGWRWRVMRDTSQLDAGMERTKDEAARVAGEAKRRVMKESLQLALTV
jgi:uncharacterized protein (DUF302 family)